MLSKNFGRTADSSPRRRGQIIFNRNQLLNLLKILISLGLMAFIIATVDLSALARTLLNARPGFLLVALGLVMIGVVLRAWRWQILLHDQGVRVGLKELTGLWFISFLFNNLLPSGIGGDAVKIYELSRSSERGAETVSSVLVDRFLGIMGLLGLALVALFFSWRLIPIEVVVLTVGIFGAGLVGGFLVIDQSLWRALQARLPLLRRVDEIKTVKSFIDSLGRYRLRALLRSFGVSVLFNLSLIAMNVFIGLSLGLRINLTFYFVFVPLTSLVLILPISVGGLGAREQTYITLFAQAGVPQESALALSLLVYALGNLATGLVGGVLYLSRGARRLAVEREA
ncbi:MAG: lysylphosphatidylglycerol synthase transmembrane domain-containing protein [Anaerolineae bacterium]